jgi:hypothetical protein
MCRAGLAAGCLEAVSARDFATMAPCTDGGLQVSPVTAAALPLPKTHHGERN